ncbi:hypothetical protein [Nocardioides jensenii]|uniref:hypothetical protein n=1 Tax=Nocardioides jensenii TaxID=1843 RepID=UPI00082A25D8|nr:hypothetical protein [Nocardioides jensenii]
MATEDPVPAADRHRRRVLIVAVAVTLLLLVGGALLWAVLDNPDDASVDAEQACEIVDRLPDDMTQDDADTSRDQLRLGAALGLALAAQEGDDDYDALADAATKARGELNMDFQLSRDTLDELRSECDEID